MKILLVKPPEAASEREGPAKMVDHIGLSYIAAVLRSEGIEAQILDAALGKMDIEGLADSILKNEFDVLGISIPYQWSLPYCFSLVKDLRSRGMNKPILAGGHPASHVYEIVLSEENMIDFVSVGESEYTVLEFMKAMENGSGFDNIKGLAMRKNGEIVFNGYRELIENLDDLPLPARDNLGEILRRVSTVPVAISASRGCSWAACTFCDIQSFYGKCKGSKWRGRSPEKVVDEMEMLMGIYGCKKFNFVDDDFFGPKEISKDRIDRFCNEIKRRGLKIEFFIACNVRDIAEEPLLKLKEAGLVELFLGIESGCSRALKTFNKCATVESNRNAILTVKKLGINCQCGSILLDPYSTIDEIKENIDFWESVGELAFSAYKELVPYYGTPLFKKLENENRLNENNYEFTYYHTLDKDVAKLNNLIRALRRDYMRVFRGKIIFMRGKIMNFAKDNGIDVYEFIELIDELKELYVDLSNGVFNDFIKNALDDIHNIDENDFDKTINKLLKNYITRYSNTMMQVEAKFSEVMNQKKASIS